MGVGGEAGGPWPAQPVTAACAAGETGERASTARRDGFVQGVLTPELF